MPLSVEEGIANGVPEVRKCVRYQIKYGAKVIKISASGGVMSHSGAAGAQQYSDEELAAIVDEAHRAGIRVAAHAHGDAGIRACIRAGVDCIEHGSLASDDTIRLMVEHGTYWFRRVTCPKASTSLELRRSFRPRPPKCSLGHGRCSARQSLLV
jgi:imidazolonepropionase-like amidohydrolase